MWPSLTLGLLTSVIRLSPFQQVCTEYVHHARHSVWMGLALEGALLLRNVFYYIVVLTSIISFEFFKASFHR